MSRKMGDRRQAEPPKRVENRKYHAYIATPAYNGQVDTDFAQSIAEACFMSALRLVNVTASVMGNGAFIELARNIFVSMFLREERLEDCTHLFFIDSDLRWPWEGFVGLVRSGHPLSAGVYRRRQEPEDYPVRWVEHPTEGGLWVEQGFVMCDRVPTGFMCIERRILEEMAADAPKLEIYGQEHPVPELFYTESGRQKNERELLNTLLSSGRAESDLIDYADGMLALNAVRAEVDENNQFMGEDYCFCDDYAARYETPIAVWPDMDFVHGGYPCNFGKYLCEQIEKAEQELSKNHIQVAK